MLFSCPSFAVFQLHALSPPSSFCDGHVSLSIERNHHQTSSSEPGSAIKLTEHDSQLLIQAYCQCGFRSASLGWEAGRQSATAHRYGKPIARTGARRLVPKALRSRSHFRRRRTWLRRPQRRHPLPLCRPEDRSTPGRLDARMPGAPRHQCSKLFPQLPSF